MAMKQRASPGAFLSVGVTKVFCFFLTSRTALPQALTRRGGGVPLKPL